MAGRTKSALVGRFKLSGRFKTFLLEGEGGGTLHRLPHHALHRLLHRLHHHTLHRLHRALSLHGLVHHTLSLHGLIII